MKPWSYAHYFRRVRDWGRGLRSPLFTFGATFLFCSGAPHLLQAFIIAWIPTSGASMLPNIHNGDHLLGSPLPLAVRRGGIRRGDVVVSADLRDRHGQVVKRVKYVEGDWVPRTVETGSGSVVEYGGVCVPGGCVWLEGDNRDCSLDSRHYGPVPMELIQQKILFVSWPPHRIGPVGSRAVNVASLK
eukprot:GHVU01140289.1.p1 GENE.GHVU01140289.1~~GHVU01140289.1.p1  ORF type:complete len:187 (+),score=21.96 GHVU01140289.1:229-789(+)